MCINTHVSIWFRTSQPYLMLTNIIISIVITMRVLKHNADILKIIFNYQ